MGRVAGGLGHSTMRPPSAPTMSPRPPSMSFDPRPPSAPISSRVRSPRESYEATPMSVQISKRAQSPLESPSAVQTASVDPSQLRPQSARQHPSVDVNRARPSTSSDFAQQPHAFDYVGPTSSERASPNVLTELHAFSSRAQLPLRIPHRPNSASTIIQPTGDGLPPRFITSAPVDVAMHPTRLKQTPPSLKQSARLIKQSVRAVAPQKLVLDLRSQIFPTKAALTTSPREVPFTLAPGSFEHYETLATMRRAPLLKYLDDTQLHELLRLGRHKSFPRYSILLREGTRGCQLFVLLSGQAASASSKTSGYNVVAGGQTHERGACFGAPGLVTPILRDNTVSALSLCRVLILERWQLMRPPPPKPPPKPSRRPSQEAEDAQEDAPAAAPPSTAAAVAGGAGVAAETEDPEAGCDVHTRLASKGTQGTPSVLMECIQAGLEWAALKQAVFVGLLENVPFFDRMAESRRQELAQLMDLETHEAGAVLFREGDFGGRFQILSEGALEVLKYVGREASTGEAKYATIATVSHVLDRPWVGEMGLWLNKPRQGTAVVSEGGVRLLCVPPHHFETFVALCPDFRMYLNKSHAQVDKWGEGEADPTGGITAEQGSAEEKAAITHVEVGVQWKTGGGLGGLGQEIDGERCFFAERWERMVAQLLFQDEAYSKYAPTLSLDVGDYETRPRVKVGSSFYDSSDDRRQAIKKSVKPPSKRESSRMLLSATG